MHVGKNDANDYFMTVKDNNNIKITKTDLEKDLGVLIDKNLNFSQHIISKVNIAYRNLGMISRTFTYMNKNMFLTLYKSLLRPHLEYASVIWSPRYKKDAILLENVQRRATRMLRYLRNKNILKD